MNPTEPPAFVFEHASGLTLSSSITSDELAGVEGIAKREMEAGFVWYDLPKHPAGESSACFSLCFEGVKLHSISVSFLVPGEKGWAHWSEEKQVAVARLISDWFISIGFPPGSYSWGAIWAGYEPRAGFSAGIIRYS